MRTACITGFLMMTVASGVLRQNAIREELLRTAEQMLRDVRARDPGAVIAHYDPGPDFAHIEDGVARTWPELEKQMRAFIPAVRENNLHWVGSPSILLVNEGAAVIFGRHRFSGIDAAGTPLPPHEGYWTGVMRRTPAGWKIVHSHSSDSPAAGR